MLKKPSELFEKKEEKLADQLLEESQASSKAVKSFRDSVQKINSLSDFSETLDNYQKSVDDVSNLSKEVETLREDIKDLLTSEDLDRAMMGHIVLIDKTISDLQENVKSINEKKLKEIRGSVSLLTASVDEFLEVDAPKYKKLLLDHEKRSYKRYEDFEETVNTAFKDVVEEVDTTISKIYDEITSTVDGINEESFKSLLEDVRDLGKKQEDKYKKIVVDSEVRLDERYASVSNRFEEQYQSLQESVDTRCEDLTSLIEDVRDLDEKREDKYKKIIVDTEVRLDDRYVSFEESVNTKFEEKYNTLQESVDARCESLTHLIGQLTDQVSLVEGSNSDIIKSLNEKVGEVLTIKRSFSDVKKTFTEQQSELEKYKKEISKEVTSLKADVLRNETHIKNEAKSNVEFKEEIKSYNEYYKSKVDNAVKDTKEAIKKLDFNKVEKQNYELSNKIKRLEELFDSFSEKAILSESLLAEPPSTNNEDPLTPLDQKFVTFDQLNNHYRTFINRIQQQLATLGGGGEVRLEFLDDVDRDSVKVDGRVLAYQSSTGKFIGTTSSGSGLPSGTVGQLLQHNGSSFVGIASTGFRDYVIDQAQGYYAYTTDYYTVGVANTTQEIEEGVWTLIKPQVASDGLYNHQPTCMDEANSGDPWVGSGATIGTGQTEFSLAGTKPGTSCIVRSVFRFEPDTDETDLDMRLHFTTNTATQGTGLTNFNIEKQALVMTVGAAVTYTSETLISFFVGDTLYGDTKADAGSFCVEVNGTTDGTLEILGLTVMVDI